MIYLQALQPLCFDGGQQVRHEDRVDRLAVYSRRRRQQRRRRLVLDVAFERLLRGRHHARFQGAPA
jgi:hypothetical protein